ncbi:MAG: purine-binding chemotaxis protein CheW [Bdellovibrionales bacterium]|nr:purine-binding chemotaxis protein CheW [Bdellovibrionales bacterium]
MMKVRDTEKVNTKEQIERFIEFSLGKEFYAIPLLTVKEVIAVPKMTPIPNAPAYFEGIMNLRGRVISVIDLRKKLKIAAGEDLTEEAVIILDFKQIHIGIIVDMVHTVLTLSKSQISPAPEGDFKSNNESFKGVVSDDKKMTVILDIVKTLELHKFPSTAEPSSSVA